MRPVAVETRRKQQRIPIHLPIPLRIEEGGRSIEVRGEISNLSESGLLLKCPRPLAARARVRLRILWPPARTCFGRGELVWQRSGSAGLALDQVNDDFVQLVRVLEMSDEAERRELIALLRSPLLEVEAPAAPRVEQR
jgi:hypothetical protein